MPVSIYLYKYTAAHSQHCIRCCLAYFGRVRRWEHIDANNRNNIIGDNIKFLKEIDDGIDFPFAEPAVKRLR
jgi:hypothetical protein